MQTAKLNRGGIAIDLEQGADEADAYVFPPDLAWTMVFTHEDGWLGPYFSRATWVDKPPTEDSARVTARKRPR